MNRRTKFVPIGKRNNLRFLAALFVALTFSTVLTGCSNSEPHGTEIQPMYSGEVFVSSETVSFASGESMRCFGQKTRVRDGAMFCEWEKAPLINLKLSEDSAKDWELVFLDLNKSTIVCLAADFNNSAMNMDCRQDPILR